MKKVICVLLAIFILCLTACSGTGKYEGLYMNVPASGDRVRLIIAEDGTFTLKDFRAIETLDSGKVEKDDEGGIILTADDGSVYYFTSKGDNLVLNASKSSALPDDEKIAAGFTDGVIFKKRVK